MSDTYRNISDEELLDRWNQQVDKDLETITDLEELEALKAVSNWVINGD